MFLLRPNVGDCLADMAEASLTFATTGSFLFIFLGVDTLTAIMLPILSVHSSAYLPSFV